MKSGAESRVGAILTIGFVMIPLGFIILIATLFSGAGRIGVSRGSDPGMGVYWPIGANCLLIGLCLVAYGYISGYLIEKRAERGTGKVVQFDDVKVVSRTAYNSEQEMVYDEFYFDDPGVKFYIKLQLPNGRIEEFATRKEVFLNCGDGMTGIAMIDGKWLGGFTAKIGPK